MKEKKYLIGVDGGTTGAKTGVYDFKGKLIGGGHLEAESIYPQPGWVENDAVVVKNLAFESCRLAIENAGIDPEEIAAVSISSPGPVLAFLDEEFRPMRTLIGWQDGRGAPYIEKLRETIDVDLRRQVSGAHLSNRNALGKLLWVREQQPEIFEKSFLLAEAQGYLLSCFGADRIVIDMGSAGRLQLVDIRTRKMSRELADMLGFSIDRFPELVESGTCVGTVTEEVSGLSGLPKGTPVIVGAHDQTCNQVGIGAIRNGDNCVNSGTFGNCSIVTDQLPEKKGGQFVYKCSTNMKNWTVEGMTMASAVNFKWFRDNLATLEKTVARDMGKDTYDIMAIEAGRSKPGANGVTYLPYMTGCMMGTYRTAESAATFTGMTLTSTKSDMVRAVMEGICYDLYDLAVQQQEMGCELNKVRLSGGVTKSPLWCQMFADIFNKPVELTAAEETGTLGAAMFAGIGAGVFKDLEDAADQCVQVVKQYLPNPDVREAYDQAFTSYMELAKKLNA